MDAGIIGSGLSNHGPDGQGGHPCALWVLRITVLRGARACGSWIFPNVPPSGKKRKKNGIDYGALFLEREVVYYGRSGDYYPGGVP